MRFPQFVKFISPNPHACVCFPLQPLDGEQTEGASGVTTDSVLQHVEETVTTELAGDPQALKEPGTGCAKPV